MKLKFTTSVSAGDKQESGGQVKGKTNPASASEPKNEVVQQPQATVGRKGRAHAKFGSVVSKLAEVQGASAFSEKRAGSKLSGKRGTLNSKPAKSGY